jgi:hypothetical protein
LLNGRDDGTSFGRWDSDLGCRDQQRPNSGGKPDPIEIQYVIAFDAKLPVEQSRKLEAAVPVSPPNELSMPFAGKPIPIHQGFLNQSDRVGDLGRQDAAVARRNVDRSALPEKSEDCSMTYLPVTPPLSIASLSERCGASR